MTPKPHSIREALGIVSDPETPEQRDEAWAYIEEQLCAAETDRDMWRETADERLKLTRVIEEQFGVYEKALERVEHLLGVVGLTGLPEKTDRAICEAWAVGREKRPDPELIPHPYKVSSPASGSRDE